MLDDFSVSPERWTPEQELVDELGSLSGPERYLAWRRYTRRAGVTELLYVRSGQGGLPALFRSDSVLDIDLLGQRLSKQGGPLFIQEALPSPRNSWLKDSRGFHYSAELVIAWHGDQAFWASIWATKRHESLVDFSSRHRPAQPAIWRSRTWPLRFAGLAFRRSFSIWISTVSLRFSVRPVSPGVANGCAGNCPPVSLRTRGSFDFRKFSPNALRMP